MSFANGRLNRPQYTGSSAFDGFKCFNIEAKELSLLKVTNLAFVQHPACNCRQVTRIVVAHCGFVE